MLLGIELEEVPKECHECPLQLKFKDGEQDDWYARRCVVERRMIEYPRTQWCPLRNIVIDGDKIKAYKL